MDEPIPVIPDIHKISRMTQSTAHSSASSSDMEIIVHLGVHKTATTYLQSRLALNVMPLQERSVFFVRTGEMRKVLLEARSTERLSNKLPMVRSWRTAGVYREYLRNAVSAKCKRMIISEENLLGSLAILVKTGQFYPDIRRRLQPVFQGLGRRPVTALLALRSYDSFFASVCSQFIRGEGYWKIDDEIKTRLLSVHRGWIDVIEDITQALPEGSRFQIWRFEDFIHDQSAMLSAMVREENLDCLAPLNSRPLPRLSIRAMKRLEELHAAGKPTGAEDVKRVGKRFSIEKGFKPFSPWTAEENSLLAKRYHEDVARICERWPGIMIGRHNAGPSA